MGFLKDFTHWTFKGVQFIHLTSASSQHYISLDILIAHSALFFFPPCSAHETGDKRSLSAPDFQFPRWAQLRSLQCTSSKTPSSTSLWPSASSLGFCQKISLMLRELNNLVKSGQFLNPLSPRQTAVWQRIVPVAQGDRHVSSIPECPAALSVKEANCYENLFKMNVLC